MRGSWLREARPEHWPFLDAAVRMCQPTRKCEGFRSEPRVFLNWLALIGLLLAAMVAQTYAMSRTTTCRAVATCKRRRRDRTVPGPLIKQSVDDVRSAKRNNEARYSEKMYTASFLRLKQTMQRERKSSSTSTLGGSSWSSKRLLLIEKKGNWIDKRGQLSVLLNGRRSRSSPKD
jgi:hypothetical protein